MSRRVAASLLVASAAILAPFGAAADDGDLLASTAATSDEAVGVIEVAAAVESYGGPQSARCGTHRVRCCTWAVFVPPITPSAGGAAEIAFAQAAANDSTLYTKTCPTASGTVSSFALVPNRISVEHLITSAANRVRAQIPSPELNISPPPEVGGTVNVGMWLAVDDPGQVSITASVGPVWATITAVYDRTVWDFGNDDRVECRGIGVPIVDLDILRGRALRVHVPSAVGP